MVKFSRPGWRVAALSLSLVASLAALPNNPASAESNRSGASPKVVALGLNNPRHIRWSDGALYVAEAGTGGSGACIPAAEGEACYGASGSITRIRKGGQSRVVTGLPSIAGESGESATGPADVSVRGRSYKVVLGLGADPALRAQLPGRGQKLATLSQGTFGRSGLWVVADLARNEAKNNPDGAQLDTNPVALLSKGRRDVVVDAGGNALVSVKRHRIRTVATFPTVQVPAPDFLGLPPGTLIPMDAVPTAAAYGPDGALYVSQLTGFPFPVGGASIWRVAPGQAPTKYATGLTNVTDLAFGRDGSLYAVQIANAGLLAPQPVGSVVRIPREGGASHTTLVDGLNGPYGIALHDGSAYVTTCSTCAGDGEVLRVPLWHRDS